MASTLKTALDKLSIINQSLSLIGSERVQLSALTDTGTIKDQAILHYDPAVQELTRMHAWNCCKHRTEITEGGGVDASLPFAHDWGVPADTQRVLYVTGSSTESSVRPKTDFAVLTDFVADGSSSIKIISTDNAGDASNSNKLYLQHLVVPDEEDMDAMFVSCLRTLLASKLAVPVAGDVNRKFELLKYLYEKLLPEARRANTMEGLNDPAVDQSYLETPMSPFTYKSYLKV